MGTLVANGVPEADDLAAVKQYRESKHLSASLQSLLNLQWSCHNSAHLSHNGRLFLVGSSSERNNVLCLLESAGQQGCTVLRLVGIAIPSRMTPLTIPSHRLLFGVSVKQLGLLTPESQGRNSFIDDEERMPKRQKLSTLNQYGGSESASSTSGMSSLCQELEQCSFAPNPDRFQYADVNRQQFEFEPKASQMAISKRWKTSKIASLADLLRCPVHDVILDRERILLALALVRGTLKSHSTEGWPKGCVLGGLGFLHDPKAGFDASAVLETLSMEIRVGSDGTVDTDMDGSSMVSEEELRYTYGVRNQVLYRLGVALLSIGLWTRLRWEDVGMVRRKAESFDSLGGKRYREAVRRLISGEFGVETNNLDDEQLQAEIHRSIIVPLEKRAGIHRQMRPQDRVEAIGGREGQEKLRWSGKAVRWDGETPAAFAVR